MAAVARSAAIRPRPTTSRRRTRHARTVSGMDRPGVAPDVPRPAGTAGARVRPHATDEIADAALGVTARRVSASALTENKESPAMSETGKGDAETLRRRAASRSHRPGHRRRPHAYSCEPGDVTASVARRRPVRGSSVASQPSADAAHQPFPPGCSRVNFWNHPRAGPRPAQAPPHSTDRAARPGAVPLRTADRRTRQVPERRR